MARLTEIPPETYTALEHIRETALLRFNSLFTEGARIWTKENVEQFHTRFVENFDEGEGDFLEKFAAQLEGCSDDVVQFAGELLYVQQFFTSLTKAKKKLQNVTAVFAWAKRVVVIPPWAEAGLKSGLAKDLSFNQHRPFHLAWLADFLLEWHELDDRVRLECLNDPWRFREVVHAVEATHKAFQPMREGFLYMMFPDSFENISSRTEKKKIRNALGKELGLPQTENIDKDLFDIRGRLSPEVGEGFAFYRTPVLERWSDNATPEPVVTKDALLQAMEKFDVEYRQLPEWSGWEANGNYKFAAVKDGVLYPPKQILSMVTGKDKNSFSGGDVTNKLFTSNSIPIQELRAVRMPVKGLNSALTSILGQYVQAKQSGAVSKDHAVFAAFRAGQVALSNASIVTSRPTLKVTFSVGKGNYSAIPWIALLDTRETESTQTGRYVVFLFRSDCTGLYLTLNQGINAPKKELGRPAALKQVRERAAAIRQKVPSLRRAGYSLDNDIELRDAGLGADYEAGTIAHKFYSADAIPSDESLEADLAAVLDAYDLVLESETSAWIFQCNPEIYDLSAALESLDQLSWTVKQHASDINAGDRVYLWESGKNAGILASATVVDGVSERDDDDESKAFWKKPPDGTPSPRLTLRIDQVLDEKIPKSRLQQDPHFDDLAFLKAPMGTNFAITEAHRRALDEMFEATTIAPDELCTGFASALRVAGLTFGDDHDAFTRCFFASLLTKPFVILTGLSGSGKTQLALKLGEWIGADRYKVIPVRPDWTGPEALLGYEDALLPPVGDRRAWHAPEALQMMLRAARDPQHPYVLILDEMNLAHVERYFADVLSGLESREAILPNLERGADGHWRVQDGKAAKLQMPRNLVVIGTVNVDETTYMFSPKVLDRANTIEFRVPTSALAIDVATVVKPVRCLPATEAEVTSFLRIATDDKWHTANPADSLPGFAALVRQVHEGLCLHGFEFGHRTYYESLRLATILSACGLEETNAALDTFLLQKVLPRLHGSRRKLDPVLRMLAAFSFEKRPPTEASTDFDPLLERPGKIPLMPRTFAKLRRMTRALHANQFASFSD